MNVLCPEPRCGWKSSNHGCFSTTPANDDDIAEEAKEQQPTRWNGDAPPPTWKLVEVLEPHKRKRSQSPVRQEDIIDKKSKTVPESKDEYNTSVVTDVLMKEFNLDPEEAKLRYESLFRDAFILRQRWFIHKLVDSGASDDGSLVPLIQDNDIPALLSYLHRDTETDEHLELHSSDNNNNCDDLSHELEEPKVDTETVKLQLVHYHAKLTTTIDDLKQRSSLTRLTSFRERVSTYGSILKDIKQLDCEDAVKDVLRHEAQKVLGAASQESKPVPPVVISTMVREHLGYTPTKLCDGVRGVGDLFKDIGKKAKLCYVAKYGHAPQRRKYSVGGRTLHTNHYSMADREWVRMLVKQTCAEAKLFPLPRVSMSRGETPVSLES